ncbi:MAG: crossover junction endodeoxyribonuclease RuvC [Spartobacteria bacterium]|nr:crossover junction endodeoxyribonuclease RuvC [Spartobacteria bacterium]
MGESLKVLGVDTSLRSTGIGVIEARGRVLRALDYGTIKNPPKRLHSDCLNHLYQGILEVIEKDLPSVVAIEGIFFCKNVRTAMILGQARGVVLAACASRNLPVYEFSPRRVKQALVGNGAAQKEQVAHMVKTLLGLPDIPQSDAADALAMAICYIHSSTGPLAAAIPPTAI